MPTALAHEVHPRLRMTRWGGRPSMLAQQPDGSPVLQDLTACHFSKVQACTGRGGAAGQTASRAEQAATRGSMLCMTAVQQMPSARTTIVGVLHPKPKNKMLKNTLKTS